MGVRYEWADDSYIIMNIYLETPWTWAEYWAVVEVIMPMLANLETPCATVVDVTRMGLLPRDGSFLQILMNLESIMPENLFASAVVGAPYVVTVFIEMLAKLRPRIRQLAIFTATMEDAHARIRARYEELYPGSLKP